jgi:hypothetical protein
MVENLLNFRKYHQPRFTDFSDKADPTASTLKKIIITLGVSADMVLFDDDEQTKNTDVKTLAREIEI